MRLRKSEEVLESARDLFLAKGFDATTVDEIASGAGVSKATVYSNFTDKSAVLVALLDRVAAESAAILAAVTTPLDRGGPLEDRLTETLVALVRGVLRPEVLQLRRLAVTEAPRVPAAVADYFERGPASSLRLLAEALRALDASGSLEVPDPDRSSARLAYAAVGPLQDRALLLHEVPTEEEIRACAVDATRDFLAAHRP